MPVIRACQHCGQKNRIPSQHLVLKVDTERNPELSARYRVQSIPNFMVFSGGRAVMQQPGLVGHQQMEQWLQSAASGVTA